MQQDTNPSPLPERTGIDALVDQARHGKLSRRKLMATLAASGVSASAMAVLATVIKQPAKAKKVTKPAPTQSENHNIQLHQQHLERQQAAPSVPPATSASSPVHAEVDAHVQRMLQDYHPEAIVEDPLAGTATVGHEAIAARKRAEAYSMQGLSITITNRFAVKDQVVAEWLAEGVHMADFLGYPASNQSFSIRGLTIVTRSAGKIVREVLYYDVDEAKRQLRLV